MPSVMKNLSCSWLPKGSGEKGPGIFSNSNSHDAESTYFRELWNLVVRNGAWTAMQGETLIPNSLGLVTTSLALFNFYTGSAGTLTSYLLGGTEGAVFGAVKNFTTGASIWTGLAIGLRNRVCFANVKNRMYMCNGYDMPVISSNGATQYGWGYAGPAASLTHTIGTVFTGTATTSGGGGTTLTWNTGQKFPAFSPATNPTIVIHGVTGTVTTWNSPTSMTVAGLWGVGGPWTFTMGQTVFSGTAGVTAGNAIVTWVSGDSFNNLAINQPIYFSTVPIGTGVLVTSKFKYVVSSVAGAPANITIAPVWDATNPTGTVAWQYDGGPINWFVNASSSIPSSYQYAYYYYNPTTGHCTNRSPLMEVADGEPNNNGVSVNIANIVTTGDAVYTKLILCRSALGGSTLYPLASLPNTGGPLTYMDTLADDTRLATDTWVGTPQPGLFDAPTQNYPPPTDLNYAIYWNGRFWGASTSQVGILFYSARNDGVVTNEIPVGVGEESWPRIFTLNVPGDDGRITGLRVVGNSLIVLTDLSIYQVVGSSPGTYGLFKLTARGGGTSHFAACEIPGTDTNAGGDILAYMGNDGRVHFLFTNGGDYPQSYAIQDKIDAYFATLSLPSYPKSTWSNLAMMHTPDATYLVVQLFGGSLYPDGPLFLYDLDRKVWFGTEPSVGGFGSAAFVEGLYNGSLQQFTSSRVSAEVLRFFDPTSPWAPSVCMIKTHMISPPGLERKQYKDFQALVVYTNEPTPLIVAVTVDTGVLNFLTRVDTLDARIAAISGGDEDDGTANIYVMQDKILRGRTFGWSVAWTPSIVSHGPPLVLSKVKEVRALWTYEDATQSAGNI